jgi:phage tail-like protein
MPCLGERNDPFLVYNFAVEIESVVAGAFNEVSGLECEIEVLDYREGGLNTYAHKFAGPVKYVSNLILKRGLVDGRTLWPWYWDVVHGTIQRQNMSVILLNTSGGEARRWNFEQAYPVKWTGPALHAMQNEVAIESIEFAHNGLSRG